MNNWASFSDGFEAEQSQFFFKYLGFSLRTNERLALDSESITIVSTLPRVVLVTITRSINSTKGSYVNFLKKKSSRPGLKPSPVCEMVPLLESRVVDDLSTRRKRFSARGWPPRSIVVTSVHGMVKVVAITVTTVLAIAIPVTFLKVRLFIPLAPATSPSS